jgi:protein gp37
VLTKRHGRMKSLLNRASFRDNLAHLASWPLPNVWLGVSVERQQEADERIPLLLQTPAAVRFISAEPLLGAINLSRIDRGEGVNGWGPARRTCDAVNGTDMASKPGKPFTTGIPRVTRLGQPKLDWVICGGESGPGARSMHPDWARDLRNQCTAADVPFFFKQWGDFPRSREAGDGFVEAGWAPGRKGGRLLDGREWNEFPTAGATPAAEREAVLA